MYTSLTLYTIFEGLRGKSRLSPALSSVSVGVESQLGLSPDRDSTPTETQPRALFLNAFFWCTPPWHIVHHSRLRGKSRLSPILSSVQSGLSPNRGWVHSGWSPSRGWVYSEFSPFWVRSIQGSVHSGFSPFRVQYIRGSVHSGFSPFGVRSIRGSVHSRLSLSRFGHSRFSRSRFSRWILYAHTSSMVLGIPSTACYSHLISKQWIFVARY
jgi:hypothetical protein